MSLESVTHQIPMKSLFELRGLTFIIPAQQRGYKWTKRNIDELIEDFLDFIKKEKKKVYCLQPLAVVPKGNNCFEVIDGQQRLTTLFLLFKVVCDGENWYTFKYERDESGKDDEVSGRWLLLQNIADIGKDEKTIDAFFITQAFQEIKRYLCEKLSQTEKDRLKQLLTADKSKEQSIQVIWYEVNEEKKHETFRNLNSGKIPLSNTDLIKALFLNRTSGLENRREQVATLFEEMEQMLQNDSFWYMFNSEEQKEGQSRLDFIFNLVADCSLEDYKEDPRCSFRNYFDNKDISKKDKELEKKWREVCNVFLRFKDMYEDPSIYHYVGFLTYCKGKISDQKDNFAKTLLSMSRDKKKSEFKKELQALISKIIKNQDNRSYTSLSEYSYDSGSTTLRRLFVLYNIETILCRYEELNKVKDLALRKLFERFPFELLHKQKWDIEHIASKTENDLSNLKDQRDWLESIKADLGDEEYRKIGGPELEKYEQSQKKDDFDRLYKKIMTLCEEKLGNLAIPDESDEDGKDKDQLGNLTLLDSHTNRSYKNALFPTKRRIVLVAGGLQSEDKDDKGIQRVFIPFCTRQCFTKAYRRTSDVKLNAWTQPDAEAYFADIKLKLSKYFN